MAILTVKTLTTLPTEKFVKMFSAILNGSFKYRTIDKRLLDFRMGTEAQQYNFKGVGYKDTSLEE